MSLRSSVAMISNSLLRICTRRLSSRTMTSNSVAQFPVTAAIKENLTKAFNPSHLEVINESQMHNVPPNSETHFKVIVVSDQFNSVKSPVQRHRLVNVALAQQLEGPVHALSIVAKTPSQWEAMLQEGKTISASPKCRGGDGSLPPKSA